MNIGKTITNGAILLRGAIAQNAPAILTGISISSYIAAIALTANGTAKVISSYKTLKVNELTIEELPPKEIAKHFVKPYIPAAVMATLGTACAIGAHKVSARRYAALYAVATVAADTVKDYQKVLPDILGDKKATKAEEAVNSQALTRAPQFDETIVHNTGRGSTLCYDSLSGRYFYSSSEHIRKAQNDINEELMLCDFSFCKSLNDFYDVLGLETIGIGDDLGWNCNTPLRVIFASDTINKDGQVMPVLVVRYDVTPRFRDL